MRLDFSCPQQSPGSGLLEPLSLALFSMARSRTTAAAATRGGAGKAARTQAEPATAEELRAEHALVIYLSWMIYYIEWKQNLVCILCLQ